MPAHAPSAILRNCHHDRRTLLLLPLALRRTHTLLLCPLARYPFCRHPLSRQLLVTLRCDHAAFGNRWARCGVMWKMTSRNSAMKPIMAPHIRCAARLTSGVDRAVSEYERQCDEFRRTGQRSLLVWVVSVIANLTEIAIAASAPELIAG